MEGGDAKPQSATQSTVTTRIIRNGRQGWGCSYSWRHPSWRRGRSSRRPFRWLEHARQGANRLLCCARSRAHRQGMRGVPAIN